MVLHREWGRSLKNVGAESGVTKETIVNHGAATTVALTVSDMNKVHVFENTSECTVTLPSVTGDHVGYWLEFRKKGAGIVINRNDSDTIAGDTSIQNTQAGETWACLRLILDSATNWGLKPMLGNWVTA